MERDFRPSLHCRDASFSVRYTAREVLQIADEILEGTINDVTLNLFITWVCAEHEHYERAKFHIRQLGLDQGYNVARVHNESLRKLLSETRSVRPPAPPYSFEIPKKKKATEDSTRMPSPSVKAGDSWPRSNASTRQSAPRAVLPWSSSPMSPSATLPPDTPDRPAPLNVRSRDASSSSAVASKQALTRSVSTPIKRPLGMGREPTFSSVIKANELLESLIAREPPEDSHDSVTTNSELSVGDNIDDALAGAGQCDRVPHESSILNMLDIAQPPRNDSTYSLFPKHNAGTLIAKSTASEDTDQYSPPRRLCRARSFDAGSLRISRELSSLLDNDVSEQPPERGNFNSAFRRLSTWTLKRKPSNVYSFAPADMQTERREMGNARRQARTGSINNPLALRPYKSIIGANAAPKYDMRADHNSDQDSTRSRYGYYSERLASASDKYGKPRAEASSFRGAEDAGFNATADSIFDQPSSSSFQQRERPIQNFETHGYRAVNNDPNPARTNSERMTRTFRETTAPPIRDALTSRQAATRPSWRTFSTRQQVPNRMSSASALTRNFSPQRSQPATLSPRSSAIPANSLVEVFRHLSRSYGETFLRQSREVGAGLPTVLFEDMDEEEVAWRREHEQVIAGLFGRTDVLIWDDDKVFIEKVLRELENGEGDMGLDWLTHTFELL